MSATATVPDAIEATVTWDSDAFGNAGLVADVQQWIDAAGDNRGWLLWSSNEASFGVQRFYSREATAKTPALSIVAACKTGFVEASGACTPCTPAAQAACATAQAGNA